MDDLQLDRLHHHQGLIAPGTPLRDGLERILHGRTGALIVLGTNDVVEWVSTGGFLIDVPFTATALRELAKMDGAIILSSDLSRIVHASVHLMPDAAVETEESGTRHRTADRVARQSGVPVVAVSASMSTIALFIDGQRHLVQRPEQLLARANQGLQTLSRYRQRLTEATGRLSVLEVQDHVTLTDLVLVLQRLVMVNRLAAELTEHVTELGVDGRLVNLQLQEMMVGLEDLAHLLERDYQPSVGRFDANALQDAPPSELVEPSAVAQSVGLGAPLHLESRLSARGYRQLASINRLPRPVADLLVSHFGGLQELFSASTADLVKVEGVDYPLARIIRDGLVRLAESSYNESPGMAI